jgi:glutamate--cysteine ligase
MDTNRPMTEHEAEARIHGICFKTGPPRRVGVELEWLVHDLPDPTRRVVPDRLAVAVAGLRELRLGSALTQEPGGQLELSSPPAGSLGECVETVSADLAAVRRRLRDHGLRLTGCGLDPWHPPRRVLDLPRYRAMEAYFDRAWPAGRIMMGSSASVQVCLDAGTEEPGLLGLARRWRLAHLLGAVLVAAFANSPRRDGLVTDWRSTRQAVWAGLDAGRTCAPTRGDPRSAWVRQALDASVLCVRDLRDPAARWPVPERNGKPVTFRDWIRAGPRGGFPRAPATDDLDFHLTTLFPPVRPRGHLELRMIDAQPGDGGWLVPLAVTTALFDDPEATESAYRAVKPLADSAGDAPAPRNPLWSRAARVGLGDPELHATAVTCFAAAQEALPRLGAPDHVRAAVADFTDRYVRRGRCPADDLLDAVRMGNGRSAVHDQPA